MDNSTFFLQIKFLVRCPSIEQRFSACPDPNYGHICFYEDEWACGNRCISKKDVCKSENNSPQLKGNHHFVSIIHI